jgi:anti-sigma regulatory factor (Ser/Thr protein kinase)
MATVAYAVLDPDTGVLRLASAGHLPPLVVGGENPRLLGVAAAPPLGAFPYASWEEQHINLAPGETIVFYTDGLVERPGVPLMDSIDRLLEATAEAGSAEEACRRAAENLIPPGRLRDDIAIVALNYGPVPSEFQMRVAADPNLLVEVRRDLRRWLRSQGVPETDSREIVLAVNEACANAIEHAYSPAPAEFDLAATRDGDAVTVTVSDRGSWRSPRGQNRGRGLGIVEAAMDDVKIGTTDNGTVVRMCIKVADEPG